jgi:hypothetical protein
MTLKIAAIALALGLFSCSGERGVTLEARLIPACTWPAAAIDTGCTPRSMFDICEVPSGSTVQADGSVLTPGGGVVSCADACSPSEYSLTCTGARDQPIPQPASSLNCKAIPIPTPSNELFYCCPCGT